MQLVVKRAILAEAKHGRKVYTFCREGLGSDAPNVCMAPMLAINLEPMWSSNLWRSSLPDENHQMTALSPICAVDFCQFVRVRNYPLFGRDLAVSEKRSVDGAASYFRAV